jgi:hypothetical protein
MTPKTARAWLHSLARWFADGYIDSDAMVRWRLRPMKRDELVAMIRECAEFIDPPPPQGNCIVKHHAPGCSCGDL